jgi:Fe2+ transport system protein FeoA
VQIRDETAELLHYLGELGVYPGEPVTVEKIAPFRGPLYLRMGAAQRVIGREAADHVIVRRAMEKTEGERV